MEKLKKMVFYSVVAVVFIIASNSAALAGSQVKGNIVGGCITDQQQINLQQLYDIPTFGLNEVNISVIPLCQVPTSVNHLHLFKATLRLAENQVACSLVQYFLHIICLPFKIRKVDLLFPFHYFF